MPEGTLRAFADHGRVGAPLGTNGGAADETLRRAAAAGVDLGAITAALEREGVQAFCRSYDELLACVAASSRPIRRGLAVP